MVVRILRQIAVHSSVHNLTTLVISNSLNSVVVAIVIRSRFAIREHIEDMSKHSAIGMHASIVLGAGHPILALISVRILRRFRV